MSKGSDRKHKILGAAITRFARFGFRKTTLGEVAADVGIVQSALYKYFRSKQALFDAVIDSFGERAMAAVEAAAASDLPVEEKLRRMLTDGYRDIVDSARHYHVPIEVWNEIRPRMMQRAARFEHSLVQLVTAALEQGIAHGEIACEDPGLIAQMIHLMSDNLYERTLLGEIDRSRGIAYIDSMVHTLMHGLEPRADRS